MANYRYSTPEYMRRNNAMSQPTSCLCTSVTETTCSFSGMPIAMAYVPWQEWQDLYEIDKALYCGTIFKELHKPFLGTGGCS